MSEMYHEDELQHHGVKGMKWGVRKKYVSLGQAQRNATKAGAKAYRTSTAKSGGKVLSVGKNKIPVAAVHKSTRDKFKATMEGSKAYRESIKRDKAKNKAARAAILADKKIEAAAKKMHKVEVKSIKEKYRKEYMAGESAIGKAYAKLTSSDRLYADIMYDMDKRAKVNKIWNA